MINGLGKKRRTNKSLDLNLIPIMNVFSIIIPFLLMTAVFIKTAIIDLYLPSKFQAVIQEDKGKKGQQEEEKEKVLILSIAPQGFYLILNDKILKIIPKEEEYDFEKLEEMLYRIVEKFPQQQSIIIESEDTIIYDHVVQAMDRCRACGLVNILLSASKD